MEIYVGKWWEASEVLFLSQPMLILFCNIENLSRVVQ